MSTLRNRLEKLESKTRPSETLWRIDVGKGEVIATSAELGTILKEVDGTGVRIAIGPASSSGVVIIPAKRRSHPTTDVWNGKCTEEVIP